ncbi:hypothetical protein DICPUDRAFT_44326 [Dictyostelium purpureum]|uniref:Metal-dependent protein hydrolase n=1 Tax=Dictyostelium purpureum TaxID=5786 RepID=F1A611_DICPU|nr:uncharacterized protein DICPUDRAFT_44326 [Dictyostelium purpureum]EGC28369.1 hypothetical protein DICPUDRAFT_44326 [Dictyostelium purpureum]|eukprot:XP_003295106.1 hypothetical protein DICPUDRAFT_44326 [Dictyostelium purpureum]
MSQESLTICTHSGSFHADEALACYMLKLVPTYKDAKIVRSRDKKVIDASTVAVDVGAVYDLEKLRFDHHQAGFTETFDDKHLTKLSSAGLIYKNFGKTIIKNRLNTNESVTELLFNKIYDNTIEELDGVDNGVERYPSDVKPKYQSNSSISSRVGRLNPAWNEPQDDDLVFTQFEKAMELMGSYFLDCLDYYGKSWLPCRSIVENSIDNRKNIHSSGEIIVLEMYCPWKDHLYTLEQEKEIKTPIKFVLFEDTSGQWRIGAVSINLHSFTNRLSLPEEWRGKRDEELSQISGIEGCVFCHANGFIGGNKTREGALLMAIKALNQSSKTLLDEHK